MTLIDDLVTYRVSFDGTIDSTDGNFDLVEFLHRPDLNGQAGWLEICELYVAAQANTTLVANEHLGMRLVWYYDVTTPSSVVAGDESGLGSKTFGFLNPMLGSEGPWTGDFPFKPQNDLDVYCMSGAIVTATAISEMELFSDGWNLQIPYKQVWLPDDRPIVPWFSSFTYKEALCWQLLQSPSADLGVRGHVVLRAVNAQKVTD